MGRFLSGHPRHPGRGGTRDGDREQRPDRGAKQERVLAAEGHSRADDAQVVLKVRLKLKLP